MHLHLTEPESPQPPPFITLSSSTLPPALRTLPVWGACWGGVLRPFGACGQALRSLRAVRSWCSVQRVCTGTGEHSPTSSARPHAFGTQNAPCPLPRQALACVPPAAPQYCSLSLSSCLSPRRLGQYAHPWLFIAISLSHDPRGHI